MSKARTTTTAKPPAGRGSSSLTTLRGKIDKIDQKLIELINQRAKLALEIGQIKKEAGKPIYAPAREEDVLARMAALNPGPLRENCVRAVFRELISGSRALETHLRVAFLGPAYTYSHLAALHRFGQSVEFVPVGTIAAVFEEVNRGHAEYGLVPLENSTDGRVTDTLDMFTRLPLRICGEVQLRIHHSLLGKCERSEVREVYSKPQALSQCRNWLAKHLPAVRLIEVTSTGTAAQLALEKPGAAAIASVEAGQHYGLQAIAEKIEDNTGNVTRFAVIGDNDCDRSGTDKTSLMFQLEHKPGALADAMAIFKRNRLNLTWIESFPIPGQERGAYMFFIELDGHHREARVKRALESLEKKSLRYEFLGSYPRSEPVGD